MNKLELCITFIFAIIFATLHAKGYSTWIIFIILVISNVTVLIAISYYKNKDPRHE